MFIGRRQDNSIYGTWTVKQWDGQEELPDDHADVVAHRDRPRPSLTAAQKLRAAGLTVPELRQLLEL